MHDNEFNFEKKKGKKVWKTKDKFKPLKYTVNDVWIPFSTLIQSNLKWFLKKFIRLVRLISI